MIDDALNINEPFPKSTTQCGVEGKLRLTVRKHSTENGIGHGTVNTINNTLYHDINILQPDQITVAQQDQTVPT